MEVFFDLSEKQALLRPVTPGYVVQARSSRRRWPTSPTGRTWKTTLDAAVDEIDADIEKNQGYGYWSLIALPGRGGARPRRQSSRGAMTMAGNMRSRLLSSNRAGWPMAAPAFGLILLFIIVPFMLAFGLSFTNQRLFSPNPTQ